MENQAQPLLNAVSAMLDRVTALANSILLPNNLYQVALLIGCFAVAWMLGKWLGPALHGWLRTREGWPKWRLRLIVIVHRRLTLIFFVLVVWLAAAALEAIAPFPSRRYIVTLAGSIATAWLMVSFAARLIHNEMLRRIVTRSLWLYVTLYYLGLVDQAANFLDQLAINFGDFRLSALTLIKALAVTGLLISLARALTLTGMARIKDNRQLSPSMQVLAGKLLQISLYGFSIFIGLKAVGFDLTGLAVLSGAIGVGLGFGLQKVVSNLVSGVIILLDKSVKPGDVISIGDTFGWIHALGARYVSVVTRDGKEYLIPNEDLITGQVVNWSHSDDFVRIDITFGTSYNDDPHLVRDVASLAAASVPRVLKSRRPVCHVTGFGNSSVEYVLRFWIKDPIKGLTNVRGAVYLALWDKFKEHGISIPFPQREVRVLNSGAPPIAAPVAAD